MFLLAQSPAPFQKAMVTAVPGNRRTIVRKDVLEYSLVTGQPATLNWRPLEVNKDGWFEARELSAGYVKFSVNSPTQTIKLLEATGHGMVYVNGEPRAGDPYGYGYVSVPVKLKPGENEFLFASGRGRLHAELVDPPAPISMDLRDATLPDLVEGKTRNVWAAVVVRNATETDATNLEISANGLVTKLPRVPSLSIRKVGFQVSPNKDGKVAILLHRHGQADQRAALQLRVRKAGESFKQTFVSSIDGSVQYFGVNPSSKPGSGQALFLSVHGASVEAIGQADAYGAKDWGYVVCPTNRRPYGFDWEDVGRLDALEVLELGKKEFRTNPQRTYVTGHSMGGHGTWQLGSLFPDKFAGLGPCAGWRSFDTYGGGGTYSSDALGEIFKGAGLSSQTETLAANLKGSGVFIVHGDADDNVPVTEAQAMEKLLASIGVDVKAHYEKGQGHWYDTDPAPGANCVDFAGIFDMFRARQLPKASQVTKIDFISPSPGVSATCYWATIEQQVVPGKLSKVELNWDAKTKEVTGTTENVARLRIDLSPVSVRLNGKLVSPTTKNSYFVTQPSDAKVQKSPVRNGGFKDIFKNRVMFVYGTKGSAAENEWAFAKAKFDAETFYYRGNASVDVLSDSAFLAGNSKGRNVLLYGTAESNSAWSTLLDDEVKVGSGMWSVGGNSGKSDVAVLMIRPRKNDSKASVATISATGPAGRKLAERVPIFLSGAAMPDLVVLSPAMLLQGEAGVELAGFFGNDWTAKSGVWASGRKSLTDPKGNAR